MPTSLIAVAYDLNFRHAAEIFSGVSDHVRAERLEWQLLPLTFGFESKLMELANSGRLRGAIGTFISDQWISGLIENQLGVVNLFQFSKIESVPRVDLDNVFIGQRAAEHLAGQGARSFVFIRQDRAFFNDIRRQSFEHNCPRGTYHEISPSKPRHIQFEELERLPTPIGILCSSDRIAREICLEARASGVEAGRELLIIGIGNDPAESTFAGTNLSSFDIPAREIGVRAGRALQAILEGSEALPEMLTEAIQPPLILRDSALSTTQSKLAQRALQRIEDSIGDSVFQIETLCRELGVSRRALELATRRNADTSPYQFLTEKRLRRAEQLLLSGKDPVAKVGEACGYPEPHHFSTWFKKQTGMAPKTFRENPSVNRSASLNGSIRVS